MAQIDIEVFLYKLFESILESEDKNDFRFEISSNCEDILAECLLDNMEAESDLAH